MAGRLVAADLPPVTRLLFLFAAAILAVRAAYVQGLVLFFTSLAFLWWFDRWARLGAKAASDQRA